MLRFFGPRAQIGCVLACTVLAIGVVGGSIAATVTTAPGNTDAWRRELAFRLSNWPSWIAFLQFNCPVVGLLALGKLSHGLLSALLLLITGYFLGFDPTRALISGYSLASVALLLLPHGIVELLGLIMVAAWSLEGLASTPGDVVDRGSAAALQPAVGLVLIVIAAWLEANITPLCVRRVL